MPKWRARLPDGSGMHLRPENHQRRAAQGHRLLGVDHARVSTALAENLQQKIRSSIQRLWCIIVVWRRINHALQADDLLEALESAQSVTQLRDGVDAGETGRLVALFQRHLSPDRTFVAQFPVNPGQLTGHVERVTANV